MKKWVAIATTALTLGVAQSASAGWNDNWGGGNGYNDYPTWTPMYWMDEMFNTFDDNGWGGGNNYRPWNWGRNNGGYNNNYYPQQGYGYGSPQQGYGYPQGGYQQPYGYSPYGYAQQPQQQAPTYQQSPYGYAPYGYVPQQTMPAAPTNR